LRISALEKGELPDWAWDMTHTQFKRFIGAILAGDGTGTLEDSSPVLYGKSKEWLGKIQALCALHGVSGQLSSYNPNNSNPNLQFRLSLFSGKHVAVGNSARITTSEPTGEIVWCVQTNTENFYCRRKGRGYFTGNTRFQGQHRMPTKNRFSNFDSFLYAYIGALVRDIPNIKWTLDAQPYTIFEVQNSTFFGMHGDTLRGGDRALGVPNHAMGRLVSTATQLMNKYGKKAPNYYLTGHLHRSIVLPHATGSIIVNGGFPSTDEYSLAEMFTPSDSSQTFFFVHPKFGKTASYEISLKFAEVSKTPPYAIPSEFKMS
jgi:hypothetical protein